MVHQLFKPPNLRAFHSAVLWWNHNYIAKSSVKFDPKFAVFHSISKGFKRIVFIGFCIIFHVYCNLVKKAKNLEKGLNFVPPQPILLYLAPLSHLADHNWPICKIPLSALWNASGTYNLPHSPSHPEPIMQNKICDVYYVS